MLNLHPIMVGTMDSDPLFNGLLRDDLAAFVEKVFVTLNPDTSYVHAWYIEAIAYQLERVYQGKNQRLLITQPPRTLKSICTSVAFVAWALGKNPALSFVCVSYSQELALDLARKFRIVVNSTWYRRLFPELRLIRDTDAQLLTNRGGGRQATSIGGTLTGRGADIIIIDDPLKAEEANSETARQFVHSWYTDSMTTRFNQPQSGRLVLVMQRLHEEDLAGIIAPTCFHLDLPAEALEAQSIPLGYDRIHRRAPGDLLDPIRLSRVVLDQKKQDMGSLPFSAQYQQRPTPIEGNLVKREWLPFYDQIPSAAYARAVQSWDVANSLNGDYSVCTTWVIIKNTVYLKHVWRGKLEFANLVKKAIALAQTHVARTLLIERSGIGLPFYQQLRAGAKRYSVIGIDAKGDKIDRLEGETAAIEGGYVHFPQDAPWLAEYLHELLAFPATRYDDQVDSTSQFLSWYRRHRTSLYTPMTFAPIIIEP